jgi:hypothetical protein
LGNLFGFVKERAASLVSKKLGAAVVGETLAYGTEMQGWSLIVYIIAQAAVDFGKYWVGSRS